MDLLRIMKSITTSCKTTREVGGRCLRKPLGPTEPPSVLRDPCGCLNHGLSPLNRSGVIYDCGFLTKAPLISTRAHFTDWVCVYVIISFLILGTEWSHAVSTMAIGSPRII
ncbi:hypothetical protein P167DRAFT_281257 [Morchella conica CCBAS932]|uniref:Uncharacterized protein n=1 Tax=Morchella conica CCBAS932 TaxID=1392247 RepID=A0A3N4KKU7_9PEZI|nr:hypothetical protein P167DRAFT_281257 [Morchella conica CCBAS932]